MTGRPTIRAATRTDAEELARLLTQLDHPRTGAEVAAVWDAWEAEGNSALVVEEDGGLRGVLTLHSMVVLHRSYRVGRITSLVVDAPARGRGIGRALLEAAEAAMHARGARLMEVTSHRRLATAHDFYRHLGYEETSVRFGRWLPG